MRIAAVTLSLVLALLVASAVCALAGADAATGLWQGALLVLGLGVAAIAVTRVPAGPWNAKALEGSAFDDPASFWGRWHRFYTER